MTGKRASAAKRNSGWVAATFYMLPETRYRLRQVVLQAQLAGMDGVQDQSDLIDAALQHFLPEVEATARAAVARTQWGAAGEENDS